MRRGLSEHLQGAASRGSFEDPCSGAEAQGPCVLRTPPGSHHRPPLKRKRGGLFLGPPFFDQCRPSTSLPPPERSRRCSA